MPSLTLKDVPEDVIYRIQMRADREGRSLNQQAILLLEHAVAEQPDSFGTAYRRFRDQHEASSFTEGDLSGLRSDDSGRDGHL